MTMHGAVTTEMGGAELEARLAALRAGRDPNLQPASEVSTPSEDLADIRQAAQTYRTSPAEPFRYYAPLADAADEWIEWAHTPATRRIYTGIPEFDRVMRGISPKELCLVQGYVHQGKTVFATQILLHNKRKRVVVFTPDETRVLVLVKLASLVHGISAEELEDRIASGDGAAEELLRDVARTHFPHLAVFDQSMGLEQMDTSIEEVTRHWGNPPELVIYDYADLLGISDEMSSPIGVLKSWGKKHNVPLVVLHQTSRTKGADGAKMKIDSGSRGGESAATFVIGVRRKRSMYEALVAALQEKRASARDTERIDHAIADAEYELRRHADTITFSIVKNKRPPSRLVDDIDFVLDPDTGRVRPMVEHTPMRSTDEAQRAQRVLRTFQRTFNGDEEPF